MSEIEANLIKHLKFKKDPSDFEDRQEYLAAIIKKGDSYSEDAFDKVMSALTEESYEWFEAAVTAMNNNEEIPDFDDVEPLDAFEEEEEVENASEEQATDGADESSAEDTSSVEDSDTSTEEEAEGTVSEDTDPSDADDEGGQGNEPPESADESGSGSVDGDEGETIEGSETTGKTAKPKGKKKATKKAAEKKVKKKVVARVQVDHSKITGDKNKWGIYKGTKMDAACELLAKGATMKEIVEETGDTQYNLVNRLRAEGHRVDRDGKKFILTHKDEKRKGK